MEASKEVGRKRRRLVFTTYITVVYNYIWSIAKLVMGIYTQAYFIFISGILTLYVAIAKTMFLKNRKDQSQKRKLNIALIMGLLLIGIAISYIIYMSRLFFVDEDVTNRGFIISMAIVIFSIVEFIFAMRNFNMERKQKEILNYSLRSINLSNSIVIIINAESSLLVFMDIYDSYFMAISGVIAGGLIYIIASVLLYRVIKLKIGLKNKSSEQGQN